MNKSAKSLIHELSLLVPNNNKDNFLESRVSHLVESVNNISELIDKTFDDYDALVLKRSLINSIKGNDASKFNRALKRVRNE